LNADSDVVALFDRVPEGWSEVRYAGKRYGLTRSIAAHGRAVTLYAEELGGRDVVSANLYLTSTGPELRACEMPAAKVVDFLAGFEPIDASGTGER
jgi:peptide-methionine (S)-S-oxide reductase